jgi:hypothetical protein
MPIRSAVGPAPAPADFPAAGAVAARAGKPWPARAQAAAGRSFRLHAVFIVLVAGYLTAAFAAEPLFGLALPFSPGLYNDVYVTVNAALAALLLLAYATWVLIGVRPARPARYLWTEITARFLTIERLFLALPVFVLFPLFAAAFTYFKSAIPLLHPFAWDADFAAWDAALHGGRAPWELLQPLLGHPWITAVINVAYHLWFFVTYGVLAWQAVTFARPRLRMQYLLTTLLLWSLVGNLAAAVLSSAGPVYFGRVTGLPDPFAPLMAYLHAANDVVPVMALQVQEMLWQAYVAQGAQLGSGISAMPSLHVATAFSYALLGFAVRRWLGIAFAVFAGFILVGSVHLGWHYAIDGYVGIICTVVIWRSIGWLLARPAVARLLEARDGG